VVPEPIPEIEEPPDDPVPPPALVEPEPAAQLGLF
jgi:hypothetical protein